MAYEISVEVEVKDDDGKLSRTTHEIFNLNYAELVAIQEALDKGIFGNLIQMGKDAVANGVK